MSRKSFVPAFALVVLLAVFSLSLSAVSVLAQDPLPSPTPAIASMGSGDLQLSFWNGLTGSDGVTLNAMLEEFVVDHPEISVTTEIVDWNTLYTKLQAAFVAGTPPDVILLHAAEIPQFASYGVLKDLGYMYDTNGGWLPVSDLSSATFDGMVYEDVIYGVPLDNHGRGLWINNTAFENAGLDPDTLERPTTYEGWVELFQQLTLDANGNNAASEDFDPENVAQWGFAVGEWPFVNWYASLAQHGGSFISEDGSTITVNSPAGVEALQEMVDLVYEYHVSPPEAGFDTWAAFSAGNLAVIPTGTWFRNYAFEQTDIDSQAWPNFQFGDQPATWIGAHTFMLPATLEGEKLAAAETLIQWVSEHQVDWAASGQVPARLSAQEALDPENYPTNILLGQTFTEYAVLEPKHASILELRSALEPELSAALNGQKSAQQALDDAAARMQQVLDRG
jgi:ABC-type glycerol-3-phosphate transport system substrate-binding protein